MGCGTASCCGGKCVDKALLVLRVVAGLIFLIHGWGKLFGSGPAALGMAGFTGFLGSLGIPAPELFAWVVALVETIGGVALILGVLTRWAAALLAIDMLVAFLVSSKARLPKGDLELALLAITLVLACVGGGAYALMRGRGSGDTPAKS